MNSAGLQIAAGALGASALNKSVTNAFSPKTAFITNPNVGGRQALASRVAPVVGASAQPMGRMLGMGGRAQTSVGQMRSPLSLRAAQDENHSAVRGSGMEEKDLLTWGQTRFAQTIQAKHSAADFGVSRDYDLVDQHTTQASSESLVVPLEDGELTSDVVKLLDQQLGGQLQSLQASGDLPKTAGAALQLPLGAGAPWSRLVLVNTPKADNKKPDAQADNQLAQHISAALKQVGSTNAKGSRVLLSALSSRPTITPNLIQKIVSNTEHALYKFDQYKSKKQTEPALSHVDFELNDIQRSAGLHKGEAAAAVAEGLAVAKGMAHARDLANMPANDCTPTFLADEAKNMALNDDRFTTEILDEAQMKALGMNSLLSVSNGSEQPAKLIIMKYQGAEDPSEKPVALVGKGITFDSGGISIKPSGGMEEMKFDMGGAASVFGTMTALKAHRPNINVIGVVAAAENMPSGTATRPGDVVETLSGKTVEIVNTDAEGRLVLCDAMTYTQDKYDPKEIIDVATLTGAIVVALGDQASGVFSNDDKLAQSLVSAGERSGDRAWQLPVWPEYQAQLKSPTADLKNVGGRAAGAITAASFLSAFADRPWAHLDVAATAAKPSGATGRPVPLLYQHLLDQQGKAASGS